MVAVKVSNLAASSSTENRETRKITKAHADKQAATALNVTTSSIGVAKQIAKNATPEVVKAVEAGKLSLNAAVNTLKPDKPKVDLAERYRLLKDMHDTLTEVSHRQ
ncbi:hypothetical protein NVV94_05270 [Pseudomonas sp. LS1212]|uniref:hypothetical protein n=1 Tax=Pseudomonas sp. LS1212 TaxID=2972478 RepID=UPI00215C07BD|nr:hypothetical protein [Pseudomonas sp. LS1212]UVJ44994.1 hypothetical protein NVV94_05270 [Pseudomonas sp. LS1212]